VEVVEIPSNTTGEEASLLLFRSGVEQIEKLDSNSNVEASREGCDIVEAATVNNGRILDGVGLTLSLDVYSLTAVGALQAVEPSSCFQGRVVLFSSTPKAHP